MDELIDETKKILKDNAEETVTPRPVGRPSDYTSDIADRLCAQLSQGKSLKTATESSEDMPSSTTVFRWLGSNEEFRDKYARAKEASAEAQNEMLLDLGDEAIELSQSVDPKASGAVVQAVKLKADNLKWVMSKMKPKKYGDKVDVTSGGEAIKGNTIIFTDFKDKDATAGQ